MSKLERPSINPAEMARSNKEPAKVEVKIDDEAGLESIPDANIEQLKETSSEAAKAEFQKLVDRATAGFGRLIDRLKAFTDPAAVDAAIDRGSDAAGKTVAKTIKSAPRVAAATAAAAAVAPVVAVTTGAAVGSAAVIGGAALGAVGTYKTAEAMGNVMEGTAEAGIAAGKFVGEKSADAMLAGARTAKKGLELGVDAANFAAQDIVDAPEVAYRGTVKIATKAAETGKKALDAYDQGAQVAGEALATGMKHGGRIAVEAAKVPYYAAVGVAGLTEQFAGGVKEVGAELADGAMQVGKKVGETSADVMLATGKAAAIGAGLAVAGSLKAGEMMGSAMERTAKTGISAAKAAPEMYDKAADATGKFIAKNTARVVRTGLKGAEAVGDKMQKGFDATVAAADHVVHETVQDYGHVKRGVADAKEGVKDAWNRKGEFGKAIVEGLKNFNIDTSEGSFLGDVAATFSDLGAMLRARMEGANKKEADRYAKAAETMENAEERTVSLRDRATRSVNGFRNRVDDAMKGFWKFLSNDYDYSFEDVKNEKPMIEVKIKDEKAAAEATRLHEQYLREREAERQLAAMEARWAAEAKEKNEAVA